MSETTTPADVTAEQIDPAGYAAALAAERLAQLAAWDATAADEDAPDRARAYLLALGARRGEPYLVDERDQEILSGAIAARLALPAEVRVGDYVQYAGGKLERVAYVWGTDPEESHALIQTTPGGSFSVHDSGGMSHSGGLNHGCHVSTLTDTGRYRDASAWFFHHGWWKAHNGITVRMPVRVWTTTAEHSEIRP